MISRSNGTLYIDHRAAIYLSEWLTPDEVSHLCWSLSEGAVVVFDQILRQALKAPYGGGTIQFREIKH